MESTIFKKHKNLLALIRYQLHHSGSRQPILITGPTGTGKTRLARQIHEFLHQGQEGKEFYVFNTIAFSGDLMSSSLFGHDRGAFTGATIQKTGILADEKYGTILIDEIAEISVTEQAKLLVALDQKSVQRLGSNTSTSIQSLIIAATNRDINDPAIFRHDLVERFPYRIKLHSFNEISPEEQKGIIDEIVNDIEGQITLDPSAISFIQRSQWPRNNREIKNLLEKAVDFKKMISLEKNSKMPEQIKLDGRFLQSVAIDSGSLQYVPEEVSVSPKLIENDKIVQLIKLLTEKVSEGIHDAWSLQRLANGWRFGERRDDRLLTNPCLVHFTKLPTDEQEVDRQIAERVLYDLLKHQNMQSVIQLFTLAFVLHEGQKGLEKIEKLIYQTTEESLGQANAAVILGVAAKTIQNQLRPKSEIRSET